ncbi:hypothetical protein [Bifidobacterium criceti]|nr:hypothetical protein [Bifidobacterium criceti]
MKYREHLVSMTDGNALPASVQLPPQPESPHPANVSAAVSTSAPVEPRQQHMAEETVASSAMGPSPDGEQGGQNTERDADAVHPDGRRRPRSPITRL